MIVVSDTSPVTTLLQIGKADLLQQMYGEVLIPEAVRDELLTLHPSLPDCFQCVPILNRNEVQRLQNSLDLGEAEAIVLAKEKHADLLLVDEMGGRTVAAREGVPFVGLIGVLIKAKQDGRISSLRQLIVEIESKTTFYLSDVLKRAALKIANEL